MKCGNPYPRRTVAARLACVALLWAALPGCINVFGFADNPSGDPQLLSKARACFDAGDLVCARSYYNQLSTSYFDIKQSELAYATLDQSGAGMGAFIESFGQGNGGDGMTTLANKLESNAGQSTRLNIFSAYQMAEATGKNIIGDSNIRGLVKFVSSVALAGELLAEGAGGSGGLLKSDLVTNATTCLQDGGSGGCAFLTGAAACAAGTSSLVDGAGAIISTTTLGNTVVSNLEGSPNLGMLNLALEAVDDALQNDLAVTSGKFSSGTLAFVTQFGFSGLSTPTCYRYFLISLNVGN